MPTKQIPTTSRIQPELPKKFVPYQVVKSFTYASQGLVAAFSREMNLKIQLVLGFSSSIFLALVLSPEMAMINLGLMLFTMAFELNNTAMELVCDLVCPEYNPQVKLIKDMAAGAVWLSALAWACLLGFAAWRILITYSSLLGL